MKTNIKNTIEQWIPEVSSWVSSEMQTDVDFADYFVLKSLAGLCSSKVKSKEPADLEQARQIVGLINVLYNGGTRYTRNAIENEFLNTLAMEESVETLKEHIDLLPMELRRKYLDNILED